VYPKIAVYKGEGDTNLEANFVCRDPHRHQDPHDD
jgi:hypothetical protein